MNSEMNQPGTLTKSIVHWLFTPAFVCGPPITAVEYVSKEKPPWKNSGQTSYWTQQYPIWLRIHAVTLEFQYLLL